MGSRVMNQKNKLSFNLFDAVILLIVLAVGGVVLWQMLSTDGSSSKTTVLEYTISIKEVQEGTGEFVTQGSEIYDVIKNYNLGTVVSSKVLPAEKQVLNHQEKAYQTSKLDGFEDIEVTMSSAITETDSKLLADGGFELRVGSVVYMRGAGFMAVGFITDIKRDNEGG